jgi:hypothetical protein
MAMIAPTLSDDDDEATSDVSGLAVDGALPMAAQRWTCPLLTALQVPTRRQARRAVTRPEGSAAGRVVAGVSLGAAAYHLINCC